MRTLVINLTRFGDLLQTQPVLTGLKARGHETALMCLENFAPATALMRDVDHVVPLPGAALLAGLERDWRESLKVLWEWGGAKVRGFRPDCVLNLTATLPGRLLGNFAGGEVQGFGLDGFGFADNTSSWAAFLQVSSRNRGCSPYNLVDQFTRVAGFGDEKPVYRLADTPEEVRGRVRAALEQAAPDGARGFVALQLGASADARRWPVEHFARLADSIWQDHAAMPVLLGTASEAALGERFAAAATAPHINLIGGTGLVELAAVLREMRMLVTNDTGTMHLAAGLGTPICSVFLATAQPWDTGPYSAGSLCVEPDMGCHPCGFHDRCAMDGACRRSVNPDVLYHYIRGFLHEGSWPSGQGAPAGARVWLTRRQDDGFMGLASLSGHDGDDRTVWVRMQRHFYRQFLDEIPPMPPAAMEPLSGAFATEASAVLEPAGQLLFLLSQQAEALAQAPLPALKNKFLGNFERLTAMMADNRMVSVLGDMWRQESQEVGADFSSLPALIRRYHGLVTAWGGAVAAMAR